MTIYFYVAEHKVTGLKYFGKTINANPSYKGSGTRWLRHMKKHGRCHVSLDYIASFENVDEAKLFANDFSIKNDIVSSKLWANSIPETGTDGGVIGLLHSEERKAKISNSMKASWTEERRKLQSTKTKGLKRSAETKRKMKDAVTTQTRKATSERMKNRVITEDERKRISKALRNQTPEQLAKRSEGAKLMWAKRREAQNNLLQ